MGKFVNQAAEHLYNHGTPNDQIGSSSDGIGWAGLYVQEGEEGGVILVEDMYGFVEIFLYAQEESLRQAWSSFEKSFETRAPEEGDWIISKGRGLISVSQFGRTRVAASFAEQDDAVDWVNRKMSEDQFWPDVWIQNERGDFFLIEATG